MADHMVQRTLVKSPPELWAEVSDADSLGRRLEALGEIDIIRKEPETTVAWEGENVCGTVKLEPSGWGTKVTIEATLDEVEPVVAAPVAAASPAPVEVEPTPEPIPVAEAPSAQRGGFFARFFGQAPAEPVPDSEPVPRAAAVAPTPEPVRPPEVEPAVIAEEPPAEPTAGGADLEAALEAALDSLGSAHHRPFSRS